MKFKFNPAQVESLAKDVAKTPAKLYEHLWNATKDLDTNLITQARTAVAVGLETTARTVKPTKKS